MMLRFVTCVTILIWGDIFQQNLAADLEHFANGVDRKNTADWENDVKGIRNAGKRDMIIFSGFNIAIFYTTF